MLHLSFRPFAYDDIVAEKFCAYVASLIFHHIACLFVFFSLFFFFSCSLTLSSYSLLHRTAYDNKLSSLIPSIIKMDIACNFLSSLSIRWRICSRCAMRLLLLFIHIHITIIIMMWHDIIERLLRLSPRPISMSHVDTGDNDVLMSLSSTQLRNDWPFSRNHAKCRKTPEKIR